MFTSARLELTGLCDIKCLYCHAGEKNTVCYDELSLERWLELISECRSLGVTSFILTGGEPFLYEHWPLIVEACGCEARVVISTNGRHFSEKNLQLLSAFPQVQEFRTSLDGLSTNDIIRDGSSYAETLETIARIRRELPDRKIMIQTVIYQQNLNELPQLYERLKNLGIYRWRLSQLWKTVRTEKNRGIIDFSDYDAMFSLYAMLITRYQKDGKPFMFSIDNVYYSWIDKEAYSPMSLTGHPCAYNFDFLCINANGDLIFCPALNLPYASVKVQDIRAATSSSDWLRNFKDLTVAALGCGDCRYIKICGGGCRADSLRWLGEVKTLDPNSCCMMPRLEALILPLLGEEEQAAFKSLMNENGTPPPVCDKNIEEALGHHKKGGAL